MKRIMLTNNQQGQTLFEYLMVMLMVIGISKVVLDILPGKLRKFEQMLTSEYAASYRYGDSRTKGPDEGGYDLHPRVNTGNNFRMWKRKGGLN